MQKSIFSFLTIAGILFFMAAPSPASAQTSRLYFAGYLGLTKTAEGEFDEATTPASGDLTFSNTPSFAGALGVRIDRNWRVEGELSYRGTDIDSADLTTSGRVNSGGSLSTWLTLANVYYDFDVNWKKFVPYVTGGLGFAFHSADIVGITGLPNATGNSFGLAWLAGTGLKYRVDDDLAFTTGYRYVGSTSVEIDGYNIDYKAHEFRLGVEYDIPVHRY